MPYRFFPEEKAPLPTKWEAVWATGGLHFLSSLFFYFHVPGFETLINLPVK
jgi:hypothetical protein